MGCGKTTLGKRVAETLGWPFLDTDALLTAETGQSIPEIFRERGEAAFRDLEEGVLAGLRDRPASVISTGGGLVIRESNRSLLRQIGYVVWLTTHPEILWQRVSRNQNRPLVQGPDGRQRFDELLATRRPLYHEAADLAIDTAELSPEETVAGIVASAEYHFASRA